MSKKKRNPTSDVLNWNHPYSFSREIYPRNKRRKRNLTSVTDALTTGGGGGGGCSPPYCMGTGSYCGCNCKCCPPCPCYTSWTYVYLCGTSSSSTFPEGCDCTVTPPTTGPAFSAPNLDVDFPDFEYPSYMFNNNEYIFNDDGSSDNVFAQAMDMASCSIPCTTTTITLSTSGCCLYGSGFSFTAIGAGTVTLSGCGNACKGSFSCSVNGASSASVSDCGGVGVSITPPSTDCCSCCLISSTGSLLGACAGATSFAAFKRRNVTTGIQKTYLNKRKLLERVAKARR